MTGWARVTYVLPVNPECEIRLSAPRHLTPAEWTRMLQLLEAMRPGIVSRPPRAAKDGDPR